LWHILAPTEKKIHYLKKDLANAVSHQEAQIYYIEDFQTKINQITARLQEDEKGLRPNNANPNQEAITQL
jgi:hypothetical protein